MKTSPISKFIFIRCLGMLSCAFWLASCSENGISSTPSTTNIATVQTPIPASTETHTPVPVLPTFTPTLEPYAFTDLQLGDLAEGNYQLIMEKSDPGDADFPLQVSVLDEDGISLGPLLKLPFDSLFDVSASSNGSLIAILVDNDDFHIYDMEKQTEISMNFSMRGKSCGEVRVSSDGKYLLMSCEDVYISGTPFTERRMIFNGATTSFRNFSFSPDGKWLFSSISGSGMSEDEDVGLYITDMACIVDYSYTDCERFTTAVQPLSGFPILFTSSAWSGDSQNIAYILGRQMAVSFNLEQQKDIYRLEIPQTDTDDELLEISWSPDNQWITYQLGNDLYLYSVEDRQHTLVRENVEELVSWIRR